MKTEKGTPIEQHCQLKTPIVGPDLLTPKQPSQYNNNIQYYDAVINNREESLC